MGILILFGIPFGFLAILFLVDATSDKTVVPDEKTSRSKNYSLGENAVYNKPHSLFGPNPPDDFHQS